MRPWSVRDLGPKGLLFATFAAGPLLAEDRAVVVGIDDYSALQPGLALEGAVADAERVRDTLVGTFELTPEQVTLLANEAATSEAILSAITNELIAQTGPGNQAFLYFAGLGTQVTEEDGTTLLALVAWDADRLLGRIPEDLLSDLLDLIPDRRITVVVDAGFDATGTFDGPVRGRGWFGEPWTSGGSFFGQGTTARRIWSAAGSGGLSWEAEGKGIFTSAWIAALEARGPDAQILEEIRAETSAWCNTAPACSATGRSFEPAFTDEPRPPQPQAPSFEDQVGLLTRLAEEGGASALRLSLEGGAPLRVGDEATLRIEAGRSGTLLLIDLQAGTGLTVASDGMALSNEGTTLRFRVSEPVGPGVLFGLLIGEEIPNADALISEATTSDPNRFLRDLASELQEIEPTAWSAALLPYEVVR